MRTRIAIRQCVAIAAIAGIAAAPLAAQASAPQRPLRIDDLFEIEGIGRYFGGPFVFSSDGQRLAVTRTRPKKTLANHKWEYLWGNAGADVWVQLGPTEPLRKVTSGEQDGSGWWSPQWSPDGRLLAMLSTRGSNVRLWVLDVEAGRLRMLTERNVDLVDTRERPYLWLDNRRLLVPLLPPGQKPWGMTIEVQTPAIASAAWPKTQRGDEVTASVLESGIGVDLTRRPQSDLAIVDANDATIRTIATATTQRWHVSPSRTAVAFTRRHTPYLPRAGEMIPFGAPAAGKSTLVITTLDGAPIQLSGLLSRDVLIESLRWSVDGSRLAFLGYDGDRARPPRLYVANLATRRIDPWPLGDLDLAPIIREEARLEWTAGHKLLVRGLRRVQGRESAVTDRRDWWLIDPSRQPRLLTASVAEPPRLLWPEHDRQRFFGVGGGELWRVDVVAASTENVTAAFEPQVTQLSWPAMTNSGTDEYRLPGRTYNEAIVSVVKDGDLVPYLVDLRSRRIRPISKPAPRAELSTYSPHARAAVYHRSDREGLHVWRHDVTSDRSTLLFEANAFLRDIAEGELKQFQYTSLKGERLTGWLILPVGYQPGRRYPVLTRVYAGSVFGERRPYGTTIGNASPLNMQIPAAHGYAVLIPSMPLEPEGVTQDPMLRLTEGVMPAVDSAIAMGIADPRRLYLIGQSFGGYSVYGLITQTHRFAAAISLAGLSNLISLYGQFDARQRYTDFAQENLFQIGLSEGGQIAMGSPPWKDLDRYIRNSPLFAAERVQTPLMIIQGDIDYVALQQGEEFFTALYRQGKRATFVRYWGEGHVLESPANIRDMWSRIFAWLGTFP